MRSPQITGEECPRPSSGVFQAILRSALHADGSPVELPTRAKDWTEGYLTRGAARLAIRVVDEKWADRAHDVLARCGAASIDGAPVV